MLLYTVVSIKIFDIDLINVSKRVSKRLSALSLGESSDVSSYNEADNEIDIVSIEKDFSSSLI